MSKISYQLQNNKKFPWVAQMMRICQSGRAQVDLSEKIPWKRKWLLQCSRLERFHGQEESGGLPREVHGSHQRLGTKHAYSDHKTVATMNNEATWRGCKKGTCAGANVNQCSHYGERHMETRNKTTVWRISNPTAGHILRPQSQKDTRTPQCSLQHCYNSQGTWKQP